MTPDDRIIFVNTFSKNWAMTGWRMGWMALHPSLGQVVENLIQYSTSGVAQFMQRAGVVAIEKGEDFVHSQIARARKSRDIACDILGRTGRCRFAVPQGAFYLFFKVDGETDTRKLVFRLIDEAQVGLGARHILRRRRRAFRARVLRARSGSGRRRDDAGGEGADEGSHDPEKWEPVFGHDHARTELRRRALLLRREAAVEGLALARQIDQQRRTA